MSPGKKASGIDAVFLLGNNAPDLRSARSLGAFAEVRNAVDGRLGFRLGARGWVSLLERIGRLRKAVEKKRRFLLAMDFGKVSSQELYGILGIRVGWQSPAELRQKVAGIVSIFPDRPGGDEDVEDRYARYERNKLDRFIKSSRLEDIDVTLSNDTMTLEAIRAKFMQ